MKNTLMLGIFAGTLVSSAIAQEKPRQDGKHPRPARGGEEFNHNDHKKGRPPSEIFKHMDKDGDGKITKDEFFSGSRLERIPKDKRQKIFERLDRNSDGVVSRDEIREMRKDAEEKAKQQFRALDVDQSGGLSFEEFSKGEFFSKLPDEKRRQIFERMDTDGSGEITPEDKPKRPERPEKRGKPDQKPGKKRGEGSGQEARGAVD